MIHVEPSFAYEGLHLTAQIQGEPNIDEPNPERDPMQFQREADHFADCILQNKEKEPKTAGAGRSARHAIDDVALRVLRPDLAALRPP